MDVTTQAQILKLIKELQQSHDTGVLFINHDFGVVADGVAVMQYGKIVEIGTTDQVLNYPHQPYSQSFMRAGPSLVPPEIRAISDKQELIVNNLTKTYTSAGGWFGIGAKRASCARCIVRLINADSGTIIYNGVDLRPLNRAQMRPYRLKIQMVFQEPFAFLIPRSKVGRIIADGPYGYFIQ